MWLKRKKKKKLFLPLPVGKGKSQVDTKYDFTALNEVFIFLPGLNPEAFG